VQVRSAVRNHVDNHQTHALLEIGRTLGSEGRAVFGAVLVRGTDQFDRPGQNRTALPVVDEHFDDIADDRHRYRLCGHRRRPPNGGLGHVEFAVSPGGYVDLDSKLHVGLGEVTRRQELVQVRSQERGPGVVEGMPVAPIAERRSKMIVQRHRRNLPKEFTPFRVSLPLQDGKSVAGLGTKGGSEWSPIDRVVEAEPS
jgi:hypothetical protein